MTTSSTGPSNGINALPFVRKLKGPAPIVMGSLLYLTLALVYVDRWPGLGFDEGVFANPALNLIREGNFGSSTMRGVYSMDRVTFWYLPLHSFLLVIPNKLFGFGYLPGRIWNVIWGLLSLLVLYRLALETGLTRRAALWLLFFLGTDYMFIFITHSGRMETLMTFFHAGMLLCLTRATLTRQPRLFFLAGILAAAALLCHPVGALCFLAFPVLFLPWKGKIGSQGGWRGLVRPVLLFTMGALLTVIPYTVLILRHGVAEFYVQFVTYNEYGYKMMNLPFSALSHVSGLMSAIMGSLTWKFLALKILLLSCLCRPDRPSRRFFLLCPAYAAVLVILWAGVEPQYWMPIFYPTLAICAAAGRPSDPSPQTQSARRHFVRLAVLSLCICVIGVNLLGVGLKLAQNRNDNPRMYLGQLRGLVTANLQPGHTIVGDPAYLFAFPDYDLRSFLVVRTKMDCDGLTWRQALAEVSPEIILVDDTLASGLWPAFDVAPDGVRAFLMRNGKFLGAVGPGVYWPRGPIEVYKIDPNIFRGNASESHPSP
jgi:4-amino-4-deoxy-L-arabinose transferase-like glycosyltransferase